jgi:hypothetical protein
LIGFGRYAELWVYNTIRAFGIKFGLFKLAKAETLSGKEELISYLKGCFASIKVCDYRNW